MKALLTASALTFMAALTFTSCHRPGKEAAQTEAAAPEPENAPPAVSVEATSTPPAAMPNPPAAPASVPPAPADPGMTLPQPGAPGAKLGLAGEYDAKLREGFHRATEAVRREANQKIEELTGHYQGALERIIQGYAKAGDVNSTLAVRAEQDRITNGEPLADDQVSAPALTRLMEARQTFLRESKAIHEGRDEKLAKLAQAGVKAMEDYAVQLTKEQKIDELVALQGYITTWKSEFLPTTAPSTAEMSSETSTEMLVDEHVGMAGAPYWTSQNTYNFQVVKPIRKLAIVFYGSPSRGGESRGTLSLIRPDGTRETAGEWTTGMFSRSAWEARSYKDVDRETIKTGLSIEQPGKYQVQFDYTGGKQGLFMHRVELTEE